MKKTIRTLGILTVIASCGINYKREKPFIITDKHPRSNFCSSSEYCRYEYQDKNGRELSFCDAESKYSIGDTIK
jgi:hypothetical protein